MTLCRDRSTVYKEAADKALPQATQVADRWHLLKNLTDVLTCYFDQHRKAREQAAPFLAQKEGVLPVVWPPSKGKAVKERKDLAQQRCQNKYDQIQQLHSYSSKGCLCGPSVAS